MVATTKNDGLRAYSVHDQTDVALRLTRRVLLNEAEGLNAVISRLSIHVLMSMSSAGKGGDEKEQVLTFLRAKSADHLYDFASDVVSEIFVNHPDDFEAPTLRAVNGVWVDKRLSLKPKFKAVIHDKFKAVATAVDFWNNVG